MNIKLTRKFLNEGVEIKIAGCTGDPTEKAPGTALYIEHYEGEILVHIWDGTSQDCQTIKLKQTKEN
jgi:hypothetical protein